MKIYKLSRLNIDFPIDEHDDLLRRIKSNKNIYTTRVSEECGKYKLGDTYGSNLGFDLKVINIELFNDLEEHPFLDELTEKQIDELDNFDRFELIELQVKK
jgi:hypothetical protein